MTRGRPSGGSRTTAVLGVLAGLALLLVVLVVLFPGWFTPYPPERTDLRNVLQAPSPAHLLGTDQLGRDVLSRLLDGTRLSVAIAVFATAVGVLGGALIGLLSAIAGSRADSVLMRGVDVLLAFPELLLALLVVAVIGGGVVNTAVAIGIAAIPNYARLVRGQALLVLRSEYVEAARMLGVHPARYLVRHVLPNVSGPVVVLASIGAGTALITASGLSLLGLGPRPPQADWGAMVADGKDFLQLAWWISAAPGAAIVLLVVVVTLVGRGLQARVLR
ncbi:ABC transporter permease [Saccharopolyspora hirsuta]|uniref:ABC transporter permease n=1 Tax=Saccharopolyspora hirsuta TaxID=1837 RepID=A0A5M7C629_SACHI|nr:ABC transporter permease [Saccharopolyspora hirsuta]KAA5835111.1 ABC transporter permease [Saccharopolyspora hirsuta]